MRKSLVLMGILDDSDIAWLTTDGEQRFVTPETVLIQEGRSIDALFIILDGSFTVSVAALRGQVVATLLAGEIIGEISFVDSRPPLASVIAIENSHVLAVSREKLRARMEREPGFAGRFYKAVATFLADRLRTTTGRFGYGSAQQDADPDALDDHMMDHVSLAAARFDGMLKRLRSN